MSDRNTEQAFLHLTGFGPKKVEALRASGIRTWNELLHRDHHDLPGLHDNAPTWVKEIRLGQQALAQDNIVRLIELLHRSDHWRILADFIDRATFLDIETSGDELRPEITQIIAKHRGYLHIFTAEHNLDGFLGLLDEIHLLVTFNGATFDVPQMENHFHIPLRDIAHIDLRWVCYHANMRGGLKEIERAIGLIRPPDLIGMNGAEADWLWRRWKATGNAKLLHRLTRYCAADVIGLQHLSNWLITRNTGKGCPEFNWLELPAEESHHTPEPVTQPSSNETLQAKLLRARRRTSLRQLS